MRVLYNKAFAKFVKDSGISEADLCEAAEEIENGLIDARLGGFLLKKRIAKGNKGKSGGYRTIVAHRQGNRLFYLYGFDKGDKDNITKKEKDALHEFGDLYMSFSDSKIDKLVKDTLLTEVKCHEQDS